LVAESSSRTVSLSAPFFKAASVFSDLSIVVSIEVFISSSVAFSIFPAANTVDGLRLIEQIKKRRVKFFLLSA